MTNGTTYYYVVTAEDEHGNKSSNSDEVSATPNEPSSAVYYTSFTSDTVVPGVGNVKDEDIVTYDPSEGTWASHFDGSDVGIGGTDVYALAVLDDGSILMSFNNSFEVPDIGTVDDSDIVRFVPTATGSQHFWDLRALLRRFRCRSYV